MSKEKCEGCDHLLRAKEVARVKEQLGWSYMTAYAAIMDEARQASQHGCSQCPDIEKVAERYKPDDLFKHKARVWKMIDGYLICVYESEE